MIVNTLGRLINTFINKLHIGKYNKTPKHEKITDRRQITHTTHKNAQLRTHTHKMIKDAFITDQQRYTRKTTYPQARK